MLLVGMTIWMTPPPPPPPPSAVAAAGQPRGFSEVKQVINQRCAMCHNAQLQTKGVALHTPELFRQHAQSAHQQSVVLKLMPFNNMTQIADDERAVIKRWFEAGASVN